jgi:hypothetical protein
VAGGRAVWQCPPVTIDLAGDRSRGEPRHSIPPYAGLIATHYEVLGIAIDASPEHVRAAYRERARIVHPDRRGADPNTGAMSDVNEAYRVLGDPGRRVLYDRSLRLGDATPSVSENEVDVEHDLRAAPPSRLMPAGPARIPWRWMLVAAVVGSAVILTASVFTDPPGTEPPDGILRIGSCVAIEANTDVREVACTNTDTDVVIELFLPMGATCPGGLGAFRDRLGLGTACIELG